jgi:hypothetical protein
MFATNLTVRHIRNGQAIKEEDMGSGVVTTAGVTLMAADGSNSTATLKQMIYHDSGTGTFNADQNQISLQAPLTSFQVGGRAVGTITNSLNVYINTATIQYTTPVTVAEWALFSASTGGTMWDRKLLTTPYAVLANDQLEYIYRLTVVAGG